MRPKRRAGQPGQSDYDTEDPTTLTDNPAALPTLPPDRTNTELNLLVLRRYCPTISHIITIAPFCVVYTFSPDAQTWEKCGIEGTLFVNKLSTADGAPQYNIMILNRKSMDNFITNVTSADDIDITDQYIILQAKGGEEQSLQIYGLWIFSDVAELGVSTKEIVGGVIQTCAAQVQAYYEGLIGDETMEELVFPEEKHALTLEGAPNVLESYQDPPPEHPQQTSGQPLDLLQFFGKPALHASSQQLPPQHHPSYLNTRTDADFFRSSNVQSAPPVREIPPQQNALLNLFKTSR